MEKHKLTNYLFFPKTISIYSKNFRLSIGILKNYPKGKDYSSSRICGNDINNINRRKMEKNVKK